MPSVVSSHQTPAVIPMAPSSLPSVPKNTQVPDPPMPVTTSPHRSACFLNVDLSIPFHLVTPKLTVLHRKNGVPTKTSIPLTSVTQSAQPMGSNVSAQKLHLASRPVTPIQPSFTPPVSNWDQYAGSCGTFPHPFSSRQSVLQSRAKDNQLNLHNIGAHWTHFILDLHETHPIVNSHTHSIPPWHAYHPNHDVELLHFPAAVPNAYVDHDLFLTSFNCPWDSKNQADFLKHFPPLPPKATTRDLLSFYNKIVPHC